MQNIINELYKTNLKFRTNNNTIEILDNNFIPIAVIQDVYVPYETPHTLNPKLTDYLRSKKEID